MSELTDEEIEAAIKDIEWAQYMTTVAPWIDVYPFDRDLAVHREALRARKAERELVALLRRVHIATGFIALHDEIGKALDGEKETK